MSDNENPISINNLAELSPIPMLATDETGTITWVNQALTDICELKADSFLTYSKDTLPSIPHRALFEEDTDLIHIKGVDTAECWLEPKKACVIDDTNKAITLHCYHDVSRYIVCRQENAALEGLIKVLEIKDDATGLANQRGINLVMDLHLARSRRYQSPFCLIKMNVSFNKQIAGDTEKQDEVMLSISRFLRERLRWVDQISRWDESSFVIMLPETETENAQNIENEMKECKSSIQFPTGMNEDSFNVKAAAICWQKGDDNKSMINKADEKLAI